MTADLSELSKLVSDTEYRERMSRSDGVTYRMSRSLSSSRDCAAGLTLKTENRKSFHCYAGSIFAKKN